LDVRVAVERPILRDQLPAMVPDSRDDHLIGGIAMERLGQIATFQKKKGSGLEYSVFFLAQPRAEEFKNK
jgi:hypothetical protein